MKLKKVLALGLICAMTVSMAACAGGSAQETTIQQTTAASQAESDGESSGAEGTNEESPYFKKYEEEISLSTHMVYPTTWKWAVEGDDANNNGQTRWLKEHMGINMTCDWTAPDYDTDSQKLDLAFASDNLPDVIQATPSDIIKYAAAGKLVDIRALIDEYGSPLLKYAIEDAEEITQGAYFLPFTYEGTAYALPIASDTLAFWAMNFIRGDILEELGMEMPTSLSELEKVFEAYKAAYPDAVCVGFDNTLNGGKMQPVMSAYQAYPKSWVEKDGQVVYGSIQPETKEGLAKLAEWYQKGYLDPEFVTKDSERVYQDMAAGDMLSLQAGWAIIGGNFQDLWQNVEGSTTEVMPFLTDDAGNSGISSSAWFTTARAITTQCEHPEAFVYILNEYLDSLYRNELELREFMKEEYGYEFKYPVTEKRTALNEEEAVATGAERLYDYPEELTGPGFWNDNSEHYSWWYGLTLLIPSVANASFGEVTEAVKQGGIYEGMSASAQNTYNGWQATAAGDSMLETFALEYDYYYPLQFNEEVYHIDAFSGAPTATMVEKQTYLDKLETETFTKIIMGTEPLDAFDTFVEEWNANGGQQIIQEVNEWYEANH